VKNRFKSLVLNDRMRLGIPELLTPFFTSFSLRSLSDVFIALFLIVTHDDIAISSDQKSSFETESRNRDAAHGSGNWPQRRESQLQLIPMDDNRGPNRSLWKITAMETKRSGGNRD
jgi:hypothetical protein